MLVINLQTSGLTSLPAKALMIALQFKHKVLDFDEDS